MCGATQEQKNLESKQAAFYDEMTAQYKNVFGKQMLILDTLTNMYKPIFEKGPSQKGFSADERADLNTTATESTARNFAAAKRQVNENLAARGGSDFIPSGGDLQLQEELEGTAASSKAALDLGIDQADYQAGHNNWLVAAQGLGGVSAELNPQGFANATTNAGSAAGTTANQIAEASNSIWNATIGAIGGVAGAAAGRPPAPKSNG